MERPIDPLRERKADHNKTRAARERETVRERERELSTHPHPLGFSRFLCDDVRHTLTHPVFRFVSVARSLNSGAVTCNNFAYEGIK